MDSDFINLCIQSAYVKQSKCTQKVLNIPGMCGEITRHLYNNLCSLNDCNNKALIFRKIFNDGKGNADAMVLKSGGILNAKDNFYSEKYKKWL